MADYITIDDIIGTSATEITDSSGQYGGGLGAASANIGDINGDGFDDFVVTQPFSNANNYESGAVFVVFGRSGGLPAHFDTASLNGENGFRLLGVGGFAQLGISVAQRGDFNGDGIDDLVVGESGGSGQGNVYVMFGHSGPWTATATTAGLSPATGLTIHGAQSYSYTAQSISMVGDVNGDGFDDLLIGAFRESDYSPGAGGYQIGAAYIIYGSKSTDDVYLDEMPLARGSRLIGPPVAETQFGLPVFSAGDFNGDGIADMAIGAYKASTNGLSGNGAIYVVFGQVGNFLPNADISSLMDGVHGVRLDGPSQFSLLEAAAGVGDINGDGFDDLIVTDFVYDTKTVDNAGVAYVVFGSASGFPPNINLGTLDGANGFKIAGFRPYGELGFSVTGIGDFNGDGMDDIALSAPYTYGGPKADQPESGEVYIIYGRNGGWGASFDPSTITSATGLVIHAVRASANFGLTLSGAGDVNGDGYDDLMIGSSHDNNYSGSAYIVYGGPAGKPKGETFTGTSGNDNHSGTAGDDTLTGMGGNDVLSGLDGNDTINGNDGNDILNGGAGDDLLSGGTGNDTLDGGDGNDVLDGGDGIDKLTGGAGDDHLSGGAGADKLDGGDGTDLLDGGAGADTLSGGAGADTLNGGADNDFLDGGLGADSLIGGSGNDTYIVDNPGDTITELPGEGSDVVRASISWTLGANLETLQLQGSSDINGTGNDLANNLTGNSGANRLDGGAGGDTLDGGDGADTLIGGSGNDTLTGGLGADTFVIGAASVGSSKAKTVIETDFVTDYSVAQNDRLDLSAIDADIGKAGDQAFSLVSSFTKHAGEMTLIYTAPNNTTVLKLDVDGDGIADYQLKFTGDVHGASGGWIL